VEPSTTAYTNKLGLKRELCLINHFEIELELELGDCKCESVQLKD